MSGDTIKLGSLSVSPRNVRVLTCSGGSWKTYGEVPEYSPSGLMRRALELPLNITYSELSSLVAKKLSLSKHAASKLSYQFPFSSPDRVKPVVVEIADDEDAKIFMDIANKSQNPITLYVVKADRDYYYD